MGKGRAPRADWQEIKRDNSDWEAYYREQALLSDAEFDEFKAACKRDLPLTFRITGTSQHAIQIREKMERTHIRELEKLDSWEGQALESPKPLPFFPDRLAWQVHVSKQVIRKNAQFAGFQRFLVVETAVGNISRQEAVSMLPPLLLDVQPHHAVLDTCASPGSKTVQIIEALHHQNPQGAVSGLVIANDADYRRSHMLTHQVKRLNSPNVIVTNYDAQRFPKLFLDSAKSQVLQFDRILCDVPCTGDGTMRKNVNVWRDWSVGNALGLHALQLNITLRSVQMLRGGGRLVYSTCSLNPIEDEAVVAQVLRQNPNMHLVDVGDQLPGLIRTPGVSSWKVMGKDKQWHTVDEAGKSGRLRLERSMFPPSEEEEFHLDYTMRVFPHQQDTGGFFIAVLEKDEEPAAKRAKTTPDSPDTESAQETPETKQESRPKGKLPRDIPQTEDPFKFLSADHPEIQSCWDFYGIQSEEMRSTLLVRNALAEPSRTIYYVAPSARPIIEFNENRLRFINAGVKLFNHQKTDGPCKWRIQSEGMVLLRPYASKRVVSTTDREALKMLLLEEFPKLSDVEATSHEMYEAVLPLDEGCCIWDLDGAVYPLWRGRASLNLMTSKDTTAELLLRHFDIDRAKLPKPSPNTGQQQANMQETRTAAEQKGTGTPE